MIVEIISACIAFLAIIVSFWFGLKNHSLNRRNAELQSRLLELEETREAAQRKVASKAQLRASLEKHGKHNYKLVIENVGQSEARNIELKADGKAFMDHCADSPVKIIGPGSRADLPIDAGEYPPSWELEISWEDDSGDPGIYKTTLTF